MRRKMYQGADHPMDGLHLHVNKKQSPAHLADVEIKCGREGCEKETKQNSVLHVWHHRVAGDRNLG